jgi:hypothetical protein
MGVTSAAGPLLNLALGVAAMRLLRRTRHPGWLPLSLWGPVAMVQEGVTFSLGLLTPGGDAEWVVAWGVPRYVVLGVGVLLLLAGAAATSRRLAWTVLESSDPFWARLLVVLAGVSTLMLIRAVHSLLAAPASVLENLVPLAFALLLSALVVGLHKPLASTSGRGPRQLGPMPWSAVGAAMALGTGILVLQAIAPRLF